MRYLSVFLLIMAILSFVTVNNAFALNIDTKPIDDFIEFMNLAESARPETRYLLWHKHYFEPNAEILQKTVFKTSDEIKIKKSMFKALDNIFKNYRLHHEMLIEFKRNFRFLLSESVNKFKIYFPDANFDDIQFYVLAGNQSFNARADMVDGKPAFELSAEMFEEIKGIEITLMHELFHLYHMNRFEKAGNKIEERLYFPLVFEGCAMYFSKISAGGSIEDCMRMGLPDYLKLFDRTDFTKKCEKFSAKSAKLLYDNINKPVADETYLKLFGSKIDNGDEPARIGYYLGYKVIESAAAETTLNKIVVLKKKDIISLCKRHLEKLIER